MIHYAYFYFLIRLILFTELSSKNINKKRLVVRFVVATSALGLSVCL